MHLLAAMAGFRGWGIAAGMYRRRHRRGRRRNRDTGLRWLRLRSLHGPREPFRRRDGFRNRLGPKRLSAWRRNGRLDAGLLQLGEPLGRFFHKIHSSILRRHEWHPGKGTRKQPRTKPTIR